VDKKICLVHYSSAPGGIEVLMPETIRMLPDADFSVFVLRPPLKENINVYEHGVIKINYGSKNNFVAAYKLWCYGIKNRAAIFHGFNIGPFFLLILRLAGVKKAVYSVRGTLHYGTFLQKIFRKVVWRMAVADRYRFIANSEYSRCVFCKYLQIEEPKITVIYNPVKSERIKTPSGRKTRQSLTIIYVGRLAEGKNLYRWFNIAASIHKIRNDSEFLIYGDGPLKEKLMEYSRNIGADEFVSFKGYVPDISEAYHQADLMMFISEYESFGNVVVESILCGTPVIASDIPSMREIFMNFPLVLVPLDENLERNIIDKIQHLDKLNELIPGMISEFKFRFSAKDHIEKLRKIYDSFII
jgi:glycosyltransferase involved in cell wall biosynthesis